jgi:hypothetical protein
VTSAATQQAADVVRAAIAATGLQAREQRAGVFEVTVPGERKLQTSVVLEVRERTLAVHAFVARRPDENHEAVYRWLLERNLKLYAVAFAVDAVGDIHLDGRLPLHAVTADEVDRILGAVATYADESFNTLLELGFASAIRREWEWRTARGESTRNLAAFQHLLERPVSADDVPR